MNTRRAACVALAMLGSIVTIALAAARQSPASPVDPPTGVVFGRVVDHETGNPVRFADVQVTRVRMPVVKQSAFASEDGTFLFTGMQPGSYMLAATSPAHAPSCYSTAAPPVQEPGTIFSVRSGERTGPLEVRLTRGGVITGTITDATGEPVSGVSVDVHRWPPVVNPGQSPFYFTPRFIHTDVNGVYRAFGLTAGHYLVAAGAWHAPVSNDPVTGRFRRYLRAFFPDTVDPGAAVPVEVVAGQERTGIDLRLRISQLFRMSGTVNVPAEARIESPFVRIQYAAPGIDADLSSAGGKQWIQTQIPPGNYVVTAIATEPYVPGPPPAEGRLWWAAVPVTVTDQDVSGVALTLQSSAVVSGRIAVDGPDTSTAEARPWTVTLSPIPSAPPVIRYPQAAAGQATASGQFAIRNVTPGRYTVRLLTAPTDTAVIVGVSAGDRALASGEIEITAGSTIDNLVVRVRR